MTEFPERARWDRAFRRAMLKNRIEVRAGLARLLDPPMDLTRIEAPDFDVAMTLNSGQVFHWEKIGDGFYGMIGDRAVYVEQRGDILKVRFGEMRALPKVVARYFALDHPLEEICASFPRDPVMDAARDFCRGLRIIRQPQWECLATFICSSMKQVAHIRQISQALRQRFGQRKQICGVEVFSFPSPDALARTTERELRKCGLGYRAKNLLATAKRVASGEADLDSWRALSERQLREQLCELPGVGMKVANCVMLFAYERIAAFPIDVWIERVLRESYFVRGRKVTSKAMAEFVANYFGAHGGYAQQYLFHHARMTGKRKSRTHSID
ncbi:MAG: 8-oxoguanine DNA glycosylase [Verrucomicrobia bacterium]|nr:MAG: 8-oxoguanine DNA glycosylase [Verrucomicrobiota bacterium]